MTADEIWTRLYDKGLNEGLKIFNRLQTHLWYFIDFVYYVENGGGSGFLYNKSTTALGENNYRPYIESLIFFNQHELAHLIEEYNDKYQAVFKDEDKREILSGLKFDEKSGLSTIQAKTERLIDRVAREEQERILAWIEQNSKNLRGGLQ